MTEKYRDQDFLMGYLLIVITILSLLIIGFDIGYEIVNPCIEFSNECDVVCYGEGTPTFDCYEECKCLKRKFN